MNTQSISTRKVLLGVTPGGLEQPGDFCFDEDFSHIYIILPGRTCPDAIAIQRGAPGGERVWGWDGNEERPTLTPSIHDVGNWHGYLRNGQLQSC